MYDFKLNYWRSAKRRLSSGVNLLYKWYLAMSLNYILKIEQQVVFAEMLYISLWVIHRPWCEQICYSVEILGHSFWKDTLPLHFTKCNFFVFCAAQTEFHLLKRWQRERKKGIIQSLGTSNLNDLHCCHSVILSTTTFLIFCEKKSLPRWLRALWLFDPFLPQSPSNNNKVMMQSIRYCPQRKI